VGIVSTAVSTEELISEGRGVWMSRDVIRAGPTRMEQVFRKLAEGNLNSVFVGTWYMGGTLYPSEVVEGVGGPRQLPEFLGRDPLREAIDIAHRYGLEVVAWMEYGLMIHYSGGDTSNSGPIVARHPDWEALDKKGRHYVWSEGGYFHWLDPAHPDVAQFMEDLFGELVAKYPDLDGVEMDRIRYPSTEFSYSSTARTRYMRETGGSDPIAIVESSHPEWAQWVAWREQQTTAIARRIYRRVKSVNPRGLVTAAVVPPYMLVGSSKLQAWPLWADSGYVDVLEPMLYLDDASYPYQLAEALRAAPPEFLLYPGIALVDNAGRYRGDATAEFQITQTRQRGGKGVIIWDYRALSDPTLRFLKQRLFRAPTTLPHNDVIVDNSSPTRFQTEGPWTTINAGYGGTSLTAPPGDGSLRALWRPKLLRAGRYEIYAQWQADSVNASNARFEITLGSQRRFRTVDQRRQGGQWVFLAADSIAYGAPTSVHLTNLADGRVVADAVRWIIGKKFNLLDLNVPDSVHLDLKFSRVPNRETAEDASRYGIDHRISVHTAAMDPQDPTVVHLTTTPLQPDTQYVLTVTGLRDEVENVLDLKVPFRYAPALTQFVVDNSDQSFRAFGSWTSSAVDSGFVGRDYLIAPAGAGERRAQWWSFVGMDGYYEVAALWPRGSGYASRVPYFVLHSAGSDTLWRDQRLQGGQWNVLGVFRYTAGQAASVMVTNAVSEGSVVADAVRIRRVLPTAVGTPGVKTMPAAFRLHQNYPNPFNPTTTIDYELEREGDVSLKVYNLLGQEVAALVEGPQPAGPHRVVFNATSLGSGVYVYQLRWRPRGSTHTQVQTRKMAVIR